MRIFSWNVNGIRAAAKKDFDQSLATIGADVLCFQETKATPEQVEETLAPFGNWHVAANGAEKKGYSGTALISKAAPLAVQMDMGIPEHDREGRVTAAEFDDYFVVSVYVPNSKHGLTRLDYRETWDRDFLNYLKELEAQKPVIALGDFNVAHREIDIARPKANYNKTPGFTQREMDGMTRFQTAGLLDAFRTLHPETVKYSWWSYRGGAREKNVGWRLDYSLVSAPLMPRLKEAVILNEVFGSDHCPVGVVLEA